MTDDPDGESDATAGGDSSSDDVLEALLSSLSLKEERRTGWQLRGISDPESAADHSWGVAFLTLSFADRAGVDADRALRMAVLHDLAESETGDHATRADPNAETIDPERKERLERAALSDPLEPIDSSGERRRLWEEYEARETPEARFVKDVDLVEMCLQAVRYEREGRYDPAADGNFEAYDRLDEFFATAEPRVRTEVGRELFDETKRLYEAAKDESG